MVDLNSENLHMLSTLFKRYKLSYKSTKQRLLLSTQSNNELAACVILIIGLIGDFKCIITSLLIGHTTYLLLMGKHSSHTSKGLKP